MDSEINLGNISSHRHDQLKLKNCLFFFWIENPKQDGSDEEGCKIRQNDVKGIRVFCFTHRPTFVVTRGVRGGSVPLPGRVRVCGARLAV